MLKHSKNIIHLPSPAKLNLFLHILNQRKDGYHNIQTLFQFIELQDKISFKLRNDAQIKLNTEFKSIPNNENLIIKACKILLPYRKQPHQGIDIWIEKKIPMGSGLGGASSNAATTLLALNYLWDLKLEEHVLLELALNLGADVPVFIFGKTSFGEKLGQVLTPVTLSEQWYIILKPSISISTKKIFSSSFLTRNSQPIKVCDILNSTNKNDCLVAVEEEYPEIKKIRSDLSDIFNLKLTGTGSCLFEGFSNYYKADRMRKNISDKYNAVISKGVNISPLHQALKKLEI